MSDINKRIADLSPEKRDLLLKRLGKKGDPKSAQINRVERRGDIHFPLSFAQQRLWFLSHMEPDSPFYNIPGAVRLRGRLDVIAMSRSLNEVLRRHESLRTTFAVIGGQP